MAQNTLTASEAHAMVLLSRSKTWSRGYCTKTGRQFVLFSGSAGQTYMTSETSCDCKGFEWRRSCCHVSAVRTEAERARAKAFRRRPSYSDLYPRDDLDEVF